MNIFSRIWDVIQGAGDLLANIYSAMWAFLLDPTGVLVPNIVLWSVLFITGWYLSTLALASYQLKHLAVGWKEGCPQQHNLPRHTCREAHGYACWGVIPEPASEERKLSTVHGAMVTAVFWPTVLFLAALALPIVIGLIPVLAVGYGVWLALLLPFYKLMGWAGHSLTTGTVTLSEAVTASVMERAEEISKHKALNAAEEKPQEVQADEFFDDEDPDLVKPEPWEPTYKDRKNVIYTDNH